MSVRFLLLDEILFELSFEDTMYTRFLSANNSVIVAKNKEILISSSTNGRTINEMSLSLYVFFSNLMHVTESANIF